MRPKDLDHPPDAGRAASLAAAARLLEVRSRRLAGGWLAGLYTSAFRGPGLDFAAHRPYSPGDDVRRIDWNVTARTWVPHVRLYQEDRERIVVCAVDAARSMRFGSGWRTKEDVAREVAAVLLLSALLSGDRAGLLLFAEGGATLIRPDKGRRHGLRLVRCLLSVEGAAVAPVRGAAADLLGGLPRRSVIFLLSDFLDPPDRRALARTAHRHDVAAIWVFDPLERRIPEAGQVPLAGGGWLPAGSATRRARMNYALARHTEAVQGLLRELGLDAAEIDATANYLDPLRMLMQRRLGRQPRQARRR